MSSSRSIASREPAAVRTATGSRTPRADVDDRPVRRIDKDVPSCVEARPDVWRELEKGFRGDVDVVQSLERTAIAGVARAHRWRSVPYEMFHAAIQVLLYALLAGLSPLAFAATLAVMPAGRLKAVGFGAGFVLAQVLTCTLFVSIGNAAADSSRKSHPDLRATLEILLALALTALALRFRQSPPTAKES